MISTEMAGLMVFMADTFAVARPPGWQVFVHRNISMGSPFITPCADEVAGARQLYTAFGWTRISASALRRVTSLEASMTGPELKQLRADLSDALERTLSAADMAKLCGLPEKGGADTIRRWEVSGPTPEATKLLRVLAMASERYPILEKFDIFDRHDVREEDRPAKRAAFRAQMRDEARRRLG